MNVLKTFAIWNQLKLAHIAHTYDTKNCIEVISEAEASVESKIFAGFFKYVQNFRCIKQILIWGTGHAADSIILMHVGRNGLPYFGEVDKI